MGIYIKGIGIPTDNTVLIRVFPISENVECYVQQLDVDGDILDELWAVPVPPHGDLIDRDALRASIGESIKECHKWADEVDKDTMMYARISQSLGTFVECSLRAKAAPTIIPAEHEEEKMK